MNPAMAPIVTAIRTMLRSRADMAQCKSSN
jgi:hypothetical protein